ncbi:hypothetical protein I4U23_016430 [Adineta vaga]|nr:hypothetical protein I4U23_016430 [Adineta vaga]
MIYQLNNIHSCTLLLFIWIVTVYPSEQTVSNGQFSSDDIQMKRFSNTISVSIHAEIPDLVPYQVFLQILFRLPEANAKNLMVFKQPPSEKGESTSYIIQGLRMNSDFYDQIYNSKMLKEIGMLTDQTNDENIQDFIEHYRPDFSIRYYTCESFIFTLINDAFQLSDNLDDLIKLRLVITDLHNILKYKLGNMFLDTSNMDGPFYKAEIMSRNKLHLLKQGISKYITFQSFLSTTTDRSQALRFVNKTGVDYTKQAIVLYIIQGHDEDEIQQLVQPFADVTFISCTSHELEMMFSIGQIFKITSMIQNEVTRVWSVYLEVLRTNETEHLTNLTNYFLSKIVGQETFYNGIQARVNFEPLTITTFVTIGDYYSSVIVKNYEKAEFYYKKVLAEELESPEDFDFEHQPMFYYSRVAYVYYLTLGHINNQLGRIQYEQENYLEASQYCQEAYNAYLKIKDDAHKQTLIAQVFIIIAKIHWKYYGEYAQAAPYFLKALQLDRNNAQIFISIGLSQSSAEEYWFALNALTTALSMIEKLNETDYLSLGFIYHGKGQIYEKSNQTWQALLYYFSAENTYKKYIPSNHELRQQIHDDIKRVRMVSNNVHEDL